MEIILTHYQISRKSLHYSVLHGGEWKTTDAWPAGVRPVTALRVRYA